jgi:curved DNA-binding protein
VSIQNQGVPEQVTVKIPKGLVTGKKLRLAGKGNAGPFGGPRGDLYIQARLVEDPVFSVEDHDLVTHREIKLTEALLGTTIAVPTIDDKQYSLKIPPGTRNGTKLRLPGLGLPAMKGGKRGDLYVRLQILIPRELSPEQIDLVEKLAQTGV